jgi:hypothetical protein
MRRGGPARALLAALLPLLVAAAPEPGAPWYGVGPDGETVVHLWVFSARGCPHCERADAFVRSLAAEYPWLAAHTLELTEHPENARRYAELAARLGREARFVPAFAFCEQLVVGFPDEEPPGAELRARLLACRQGGAAGAPAPAVETVGPVRVPGLGAVDPAAVSLPLFTLLLGLLDGFNPCAFFVLLVLMSLLVHARSRARILLVGGLFVLFSGLFYFAFMAAWLNAFLLLGELRAVTAGAGAVAALLGAVQLGQALRPGRGPSLSIPRGARPRLFARMRRLATAAGTPSVLAGTALLAMAANAYEMLCTAGFPLVFTRVLTLRAPTPAAAYGYLALYNAAYVVPLAAVVVVFAATLGSRKLGEEEGRALRLLSGLVLLGMGALLLADPALLQRPLAAAGLLAAAVAATAAIVGAQRLARRA